MNMCVQICVFDACLGFLVGTASASGDLPRAVSTLQEGRCGRYPTGCSVLSMPCGKGPVRTMRRSDGLPEFGWPFSLNSTTNDCFY